MTFCHVLVDPFHALMGYEDVGHCLHLLCSAPVLCFHIPVEVKCVENALPALKPSAVCMAGLQSCLLLVKGCLLI